MGSLVGGMMKQHIKNNLVMPVLVAMQRRAEAARLRKSEPFVFSYHGKLTRFRTDDVYSHWWFYPRYADGKEHEPQATRKFIEAIDQARVIADIGTNLGWFTCIAGCMRRDATVYGFELDASNVRVCQSNIELNGLNNVVLENAAVTNYDGQLTYQKAHAEQASAMHRINNDAGVACTAKAIQLDTYFADKQPPEVIKIDVEGAEQLVLEGMQTTLEHDALKTILIEIHPEWLRDMGGSVAELVQILEAAGFSLHAIEHRSGTGEESRVDAAEIESTVIGGRMFIARKTA